ncbi:msx2-interacting protein [Lampris incognitus]|uniref:msx2-interacting protein n=1 Tax=Lampris incognitus TaxID=2546036 RepID=UPI0024B59441|nr:msx2-interacting protein [Lampris incognitus]
MVRETRHLWVGNLPENVREEKIIEHFKRYGRVESVKVLPKRGSEGGVAAFVDFVDIKSAQKAHNAINKMGDRDLRTDYNEPGTIPSAARGLDDSLSLSSRGRDVSGFTRAAGGPVYGPPASLHSRDGRYERRLDGTAEIRDRAYDHSAYGHHERAGSSFERHRHYETDYYRDARERTLSTGGSGSGTSSGSGATVSVVGGTIVGAVAGSTGAGGGAGAAAGGSGGSTSSGVGFYRSHSRSPCRFETPEPRYESRAREPFTLASVVHRDLYREERGRRGDRSHRHSRSRSPHSTHSRNPSPQRLASHTSRPPHSHSGSGSRSRSSSSDSVSSTSSGTSGSDSSSSSSDDSPARSVQSAAVPAPSALPLSSLDKDEPRKSFGIKVQNLPVRSTDTSLKDGLFHEFKKHGKVTSVQIHGASEERYGLVFFRQQEDQEKALGASKGKLFFGMQIDVTAWNGPETESENELRPLDERIDEFHPKATRTLFIGNLEKTTSYHDLLNIFQRFGEIVDIDIKKVNGAPQYAFLQYCDIASVCKAIKKMDGEYLGNNRLKLGFGKSMPTTCVWLDGLASNTTEQFLTRHFCRYGHVVKVVFDRMKGMALILYNNIEYAQAAVKETKGWKIGGNKIKVDFANQESQMAFYRSMQASGQDIRDFYDILSERRDERRSQYEFTAERSYYENIRTPGTYTEDPRRKYPARSREFYTEWDPYQGDYYDAQYFEDPREYREYRADPYEQDIRKYSYLQRERERERERFETDRGRDHGRRTIERSQSPSHIASRRPASPTASPSLSERIPSDSDRRICCRSSERSGSCSSISPPRFEKPEKARAERYNKNEKLEKERVFEVEKGNVGDKEKRGGRKDRGEKEKSEKQKLKKHKVASPSMQTCETEPGPERDVSPDSILQNKIGKVHKESCSKGRVDLLPCVVQLTRVKEKEGKLIGHAVTEKQKLRGGNDSPRLASPSAEQRSPPFRSEPSKGDAVKHGKMPKEKHMASLVEIVDKDIKVKSKKNGKSEPGFDSVITVDMDRLAARKRRFEDSVGKADLQKKTSEEEDCKVGLCKLGTSTKETEGDNTVVLKGMHKKEHRKDKSERLVSVYSPRNELDSESNLVGLSLELQSQLGQVTEDNPIDSLRPPYVKIECGDSKTQSISSLTKMSDDGSPNLEETKKQKKQCLSEIKEEGIRQYRYTGEANERLVLQSDLSNSCKKQIEQSQWLRYKIRESDKFAKCESPQVNESDSFEKDCILHVAGKSSQDVGTNDFPSFKRKKIENIDFEILGSTNMGSSQKLNEDVYQSVTSTTGCGPFSANEEDATTQISPTVVNKERKSSHIADDKILSHTESLKYNSNLTASHFQSPDGEFPMLKTTLLGCDEELLQRWERRLKSDSIRMEMTFPSGIAKHEGTQKRLGHDLEPGEVQSDTDDDDDAESKHNSPKSNSSMSSILREREERATDLRLSASLERNKFYSFALDKTITPDTKALLERAKTLYSSREDNWSFLPSCFPSSHSCSDKEKVELAPRPIPSWYMKKKKIRTDSEGKLLDKKDELKTQDQERQELFASRFLHSSIFEQDSRRLQRLERKDQDLEMGVSKPLAKLGAVEAQSVSGGGDAMQEPIVLFHSRFLELQQQKGKDHPPPDTESVAIVMEIKTDEVQNGDNELSVKVSESVLKVDDKSVSPPLVLSVSPFESCPKVVPPPLEKNEVITPSSDHSVSVIEERKVEHILEVSPPQSPLAEDINPVPPKVTLTPLLELSEIDAEMEQKGEISEAKVKMENNLVAGHTPLLEDKPLTPGSSLSSVEVGPVVVPCSDYTKLAEKSEIMMESKTEIQEINHLDDHQKTEIDDVSMPELEPESKPLPSRKQPKSKRAKPNLSVPRIKSSPTTASDRPATRKSERIDREKLKRASSPRGELVKATSEHKTTSKSPIHASDSEQNLEPSLVHGRTRRRNVRSVYATLHEGEQAGKEVESIRSMRKRGADKEQTQQDVQHPSTYARRGRPPKRGGKRAEDVSPLKGDQQKLMEEDLDVRETSATEEVLKASEGWRSPRTQKVQQPPLTPTVVSVNKKASKLDKLSERSTSPAVQAIDLASSEELQPNLKVDTEQAGQSPEIEEIAKPSEHKKGIDLKDHSGKKTEEGDIELMDSAQLERRQQPEKNTTIRTPRLKRNPKQVTEDKPHSLKNLEIRVSVDDVKGLLRSDDESESFEAGATTKSKQVVQDNKETKDGCFLKEAKELSTQQTEEVLLEPEPPVDPSAALLARQMELEQAVENIAKLTVEQPQRPYKEAPTERRTLVPPVVVEPEAEVEEEKRTNPASETELAAAIDSITAEVGSADTDGFTAPPTYTALVPTPEPVVSPSTNEIMEPETHLAINNILATNTNVGPLTPSPKALTAEAKVAEPLLSVPEDPPLVETPKKTGKVRAKSPKKSRRGKGTANKKGETAEEISEPEPSPVKLPESIPEDLETINSKAVTVTTVSSAAASVVTAVATRRRDIASAMTVDTPKEAEQPAVEQPVPQESAFHLGTSNTSNCKKCPQTIEPSTPTLPLSPACPPPVPQFSVLTPRPCKMPVSQEWLPRSEESRINLSASSQVTVVTPSAPGVTTLGTPSGNPSMPPDTKALDIDPSSSTLRKILMEPKYVSASNSNAIPTTMVTSALPDPTRMSEKENPSDTQGTRQMHHEERLILPPLSMHHKPSPLSESQQNCGEKIQHSVISSPTTSVISRIPMPYDTEETPRISLSNRSSSLSLPKQKFRTNTNENSRYHGMDPVEDGTRGRSVVENSPYCTGPSAGLRVNTSEGVVVLSYSGQKTEGPHRMRAKISQIPQATAGDIEFQHSVSKSQIKQEPITPSSQPPTPKGQVTPTAYGHTGVLLSGQPFNSQPVISSTKQESPGSDKSEVPYHTISQSGVVKMFPQPVTTSQVLMYNQAVIQSQHGKRGQGTEPCLKKMDIGKSAQQSNLSPVMSPHHPSLSGTCISPSPGIPTDRSAPYLKQEPQSPRATVHSPSPFAKACPPSSSPIATSVVLGPGMPSMSPYHSNVHHQHTEQSSVIMQPHSVTQSIAHEVRMNNPPMSGINYGRRSDSLSSPSPGHIQRSNTPQPIVIRDMVLQSHIGSQGPVIGGSSSSASEKDPRHLNQMHGRPSVPQLQPDVMMMQSDNRGLHPGMRLDQYRDVHQHILMHQQLGEQVNTETRQSRTPEAITTSSSNMSALAKSPLVGKNMGIIAKETPKKFEGKISHPPHSETRIMGVHPSGPVMVSSHPQGMQLMHPEGTGSFPVYRDTRGFSSQFPGHPSLGLNLVNRSIAPSQIPADAEPIHRGQLSQSLSAGSVGVGNDSKQGNSHLRHASSIDLTHMSRGMPRDAVSPSYQSSMTSPLPLTQKVDLSHHKGPSAQLPNPPLTAPPPSSSQLRPDAKTEASGHRSIDMVQLLMKYPIVWQGLLALKNDQAAVQLHFVSGNNVLAQRSLPPPEGGSLLRIVQRMRLEASQLDSVARRMTVENEYCLLLALPCGRDQEDVLSQTQALKGGFITYLQAKQAAGIINVPNPGSNQPAYVVQIFPPCEFSESHLSRLAPDLLNSISSISPHLMIVIASV